MLPVASVWLLCYSTLRHYNYFSGAHVPHVHAAPFAAAPREQVVVLVIPGTHLRVPHTM